MPVKKILSFISLSVFLFAVIVVILSFKGGGGVGDAAADEIIGRKMSHKIYGDNNELTAEISSSSSQRDYDRSRDLAQRERTLLTDIRAVIYKHGEFKSNVRFSGDSGYVANGYHDLLIRGNAKIESDEAAFLSERFFMQGSTMISNEESTDFILENLKGKAEKGMKYLLKNNVLDLYRSSGIFTRDGKNHDFRCIKLKVIKNLKRIIFKGRSMITGPDSVMKGKEIIMTFDENFKQLRRVDILGRGLVFLKGKNGKDSRRITGKIITGYFSESGKMSRIEVSKNGVITLISDKNTLKASSKLIHVLFDPLNEKPRSIKIMKKGEVKSTGKRPFTVSSNKITVKYDETGEIEKCNTNGESEFILKGYKGKCKLFEYLPKINLMTLEGESSILEKGMNNFISSQFKVDTEDEKLSSDKNILSTIQLESANSIFTKSSIFVRSKEVEIDDKTGVIKYIDDVSLFQDFTKLKADRVEIGKNKEINVSGSVDLKFKNGASEITLKGKNLNVDQDKNAVIITGKGKLSEGENSLAGETLNIKFNDKNEISLIKGEKSIEFKRKKISGKSDKVEWEFLKKMITFISNARLIKSNSGTSKGDKIIFYLENEKVVIESSDGKRSETKIE